MSRSKVLINLDDNKIMKRLLDLINVGLEEFTEPRFFYPVRILDMLDPGRRFSWRTKILLSIGISVFDYDEQFARIYDIYFAIGVISLFKDYFPRSIGLIVQFLTKFC